IVVALEVTAFIILGVLHVRMCSGKLVKFSIKRLVGRKNTLLLAAGMLAGLAVLYAFTNADVLRLCFAETAAFLLPYMLVYSYSIFESIPNPEYKLWYKKDNLLDNKAFV